MGDVPQLLFCGVPTPGFWEKDGDVNALEAEFLAGDSWANRAATPEYAYDSAAAAAGGVGWPLTGFTADLAVLTMESLPWFNFSVRMYRSYTEALYVTAKLHECDVAFSPFTVTEDRAYCGNVSLASGVRACTDPASSLIAPVASDACCADFSFQLMPSTVAVMLGANDKKVYVLQFLDEQIVDLFIWMVLLEFVLAHIVWLIETCSVKSHQFEREYNKGIYDAIYWATATVTSVGYGDYAPSTCLGKLVTMLGMFIGVTFTAIVTGFIANKIASQQQKLDSVITSVRACVRAHAWGLCVSVYMRVCARACICACEGAVVRCVRACMRACISSSPVFFLPGRVAPDRHQMDGNNNNAIQYTTASSITIF